MRAITEKEMVKINEFIDNPEELEGEWQLRHVVFEDEFSCNECGSPVYIRQDSKGYDATLGCLNPDCDNKAIMR